MNTERYDMLSCYLDDPILVDFAFYLLHFQGKRDTASGLQVLGTEPATPLGRHLWPIMFTIQWH